MYYVYWIHLEEHDSLMTQGYIGISNQPEARLRAHLSGTAPVGSKVIREMQDKSKLVHTVLSSVETLTEAREAERHYRPLPNIGWNVKRGGGVTPDCTGRKHSETVKADIARKNRLTKASRTYVSPFKGMTDRHSEETKALIGSYHKGKTISEEHKKAITEKLSGKGNPKSKEICLHDTVLGKTKTFVNLREAAEQWEINYSTLRAAVQRGSTLIHKRYEIVKVAG